MPARVSFWTGRYLHQHGARINEILMPPDEPNVVRLLHDAGYRVARLGKDHCFQPPDYALFDERFICAHAGPEAPANAQEAEVVR